MSSKYLKGFPRIIYCKFQIVSSSIVLISVDHSLSYRVGIVVGVDRCIGVSQRLAQCWVVCVFKVYCDVG